MRKPPEQHVAMVFCILLLSFLATAHGNRTFAQTPFPCDSLRVTATHTGPGCCWAFELHNGLGPAIVAGITASIMTPPTAIIASATGPWPTPPTVLPTDVIWTAPGGMQTGRITGLTACINSPTYPVLVLFSWRDSQGNVICTDTVQLDCPAQSCFGVEGQRRLECIVVPGSGTPGYLFRFALRNLASWGAVTATISGPAGVSISPAQLDLGEIPPGGTVGGQEITISGAPAGPLLLTIRLCDSSGTVCCTDTLQLTLPECKRNCFDLADLDARCITLPAGGTGYNLSFRLRNLGGSAVGKVTLGSPGATLTPSSLTLSPSVAPGELSDIQNITVSGPTTGTLTLVAQLCDSLGAACCTDTIRLDLPNCDTACFDLGANQTLECIWGAKGPEYVYCFSITNRTGWNARYLSLTSSTSNVSVTPKTIVYSPSVRPGGGSPGQCVKISGIGATPGAPITLLARVCDADRIECCTDTIRLTLPDCPRPKDCCEDFTRTFDVVNSASASGFASQRGTVSALTEELALRSVSMTLESATINGRPAYGYFRSGTIYNAFSTVVPDPYPHSLYWPTIAAGVLMSAPTEFYLRMQFPPISPNVQADTLRYCIRYRFTDLACRTCDTVICYERTRVRYFDQGYYYPSLTRLDDDGAKGNHTMSALSGTGITGALHVPDSGSMQIVFPNSPIGSITYRGLIIEPLGAALVDADAVEPGYDFIVANGSARAGFTAKASDEVNLALKYDALGSRTSLDHSILLLYTLDSTPSDTLEEELIVTLRREDLTGGDEVKSISPNLSGVRTFALHLKNANASREPIDRLVLGTSGDVRLLAVGPTPGDSEVVIQLGLTGSGDTRRQFVGVDLRGAQTDLEPNDEFGPVYVTLAGVENETTTVRFTTLNNNGQVISEGEVVLIGPLSTVGSGDGQPSRRARLQQSYPNPTAGTATIGFLLPRSEPEVTLTLTDVSGREVVRLIDGRPVPSGEHVVVVDIANLPDGVYFYTLSTGTATETRRMTVVR